MGQAGLGVPGSLSSPTDIFHLTEGREDAQWQERGWISWQTSMVGWWQGALGTSGWGQGALDPGMYLMPGIPILFPSRAHRPWCWGEGGLGTP